MQRPILSLLLLAAASADATVVVSGQVTHAESGEPMENVRVEGHQGPTPVQAGPVTEAFTDSLGNYQLTLPDTPSDTKTYVRTRQADFFLVTVDKAWPQSPCPLASPFIGHCSYWPDPVLPVATTNNVVVTRIDLALSSQRIFVGEFE